MGIYINPRNLSKEEFLRQNAIQISRTQFIHHEFASGMREIPIALVNNGSFTAAGVCDTSRERDVFAIDDGRPKYFFLIDRDKLTEDVIYTKTLACD